MERGTADVSFHAALNPAIVEGASELDNTLLQEGGREEVEAADAAAAAARALVVEPLAGVDVMLRVVARWRALVAQRRACPVLDLLQAFPDFFLKEVLERLDSTSLTMLAQVGRPLLAAVLASGLPRLPKGEKVQLQLEVFCTSVERLAWAKANGCPWGEPSELHGWINPCAFAAGGGHLEVLRWAREHGCSWDRRTCSRAASGGHLETLRWAREHGCEWTEFVCAFAARSGHLDVMQWALEHGAPWDSDFVHAAAAHGGHQEKLTRWLRHCPDALAWVRAQPSQHECRLRRRRRSDK
jgi:hypothetical protein